MDSRKDDSVIPSGSFCCRVVKIRDGEILSRDIERFGKDLREYPYSRGRKEILCPYWQRTDYGTVRCNFLDKEVIDDLDWDARKKIQKHFGIPDATEKLQLDWELPDELKICGIREDEDDEDD